MTNNILPVLVVVWLHFIADFVMQSDRIATAKSKSNLILLEHIGIYSIPMLLMGWKFAIINAVLHFATDYVSSRMTSYFWQKEQRHWFFVTLGADQAIHITCLVVTLQFSNLIFWMQ